MSAYKCQGPLCDPEGRAVSDRDPGVPEREAELIRGGQLFMCQTCAAEQLRSDVMEISYLVARLSRDADDYAAAGLLPDELEAQINALADVAKSLDADEPTERLGTLDGLVVHSLPIRSAS